MLARWCRQRFRPARFAAGHRGPPRSAGRPAPIRVPYASAGAGDVDVMLPRPDCRDDRRGADDGGSSGRSESARDTVGKRRHDPENGPCAQSLVPAPPRGQGCNEEGCQRPPARTTPRETNDERHVRRHERGERDHEKRDDDLISHSSAMKVDCHFPRNPPGKPPDG